jgi:zinc protease
LAPLPAVVAAWRVPDPAVDFAGYLAYVVLAEVLTDGDASRLRRRLVREDRLVTSLSGYVSFMGDPFDVRDPTALLLQAHHPGPADAVIRTLDEELDRLANGGLDGGELARVQARMAAHVFHESDSVLGRTLAMSVLEQQRGAAELLGELPGRLAAVTDEQVVAAAAALRPERRAVLEVVPGGSE